MTDDRLMMEGKLTQLEREEQNLELKVEGLCESMRGKLNTALTPVKELQSAQIIQLSKDFSLTYIRLQGVYGKIDRLKRELGRG